MAKPQQDNFSKFLLFGTLGNLVSQGVSFASILILTPIILNYLGPQIFGIWAIAGTFMAYGGLFDFGLWGGLIKYVAHFRAQEQSNSLNRFLQTSFTLYSIVGMVVALIFLVIAQVVPQFFSAADGYESLFSQLLTLVGLALGISFPAMAPMAILRGLKRFDVVNVADVIITIWTAVWTVVLLRNGWGVIGMVLVNISGVILYFIFGQVFLLRNFRDLICRWGKIDREMMTIIYDYSRPLFVQDIAKKLNSKTDEGTIGFFESAALVTPYNIARRYSESIQILAQQAIKLFLPLMSELQANGDTEGLRKYFLFSTRIISIFCIGTGVLLSAYAPPLIRAWVGDQVSVPVTIVFILIAATMFTTIQLPATTALKGMAQHHRLTKFAILFGITNLALSIILFPIFGLVGIAMGTLIPAVIESMVVLVLTINVLEIKLQSAAQELIVPLLIPVIVLLASTFVATNYIGRDDLISLALIMTTIFIVYAFVFLRVSALPLEKEMFDGMLRAIFQKLKIKNS